MNKNQEIAALNAIVPGWEESYPGGMICTRDPRGGIIDTAFGSGKWFVVFNDTRATLEGFNSRADAIEAFAAAK
jgi:hypothetical protein